MIIISLVGSIILVIYAIYLKKEIHEKARKDAEGYMRIINPLMFKKKKIK
jgi:hypothetical protein